MSAQDAKLRQEEDDEMPELETDASGRKLNKNEKKARKAFSKMELIPVENVHKVLIRKGRNDTFSINEPTVYRAQGSDSYIVFGEAKTESAADALKQAAAGLGAGMPAMPAAAAPAAAAEDDDEEVSADGLDESEIETIISQASCSRNKAIKMLKKTGNVLDAILEATQA